MTEGVTETMQVTLTCHTEGCANAGLAIALVVPTDISGYACGVCGESIGDVLL